VQSSSRFTASDVSRDALDADAIEVLVQARLQAKKDKQFAQADAIREQLRLAGVELEDKPGGITQWRRV
jgi:cysteinyl-tRNA synthetase